VNDKSAILQGLFDFTDRALSLATNGHSTEALFNLGVTWADCGDESKAEHWYEASTGTGLARLCITARRCSAWAWA
jgi:hypothetical protein